MIARGSSRAISHAARARTGPVPLARLSTRKDSPPRPVAARMGPTRSWPARIRSRSAGMKPRTRSIVSKMRGRELASGNSCFGRSGVLRGQNL